MIAGRTNVERAMLVFVLAVLAVFEATSTNSRNRNRRKSRNQSRKSHNENRRHRQNNRNPTKSNNSSRNKKSKSRKKKRRSNRRIASSNKDKPGNKTPERSNHRRPRTEKGNGFHQRNSSPALGANTIFRYRTCRTAADFSTPVIGSRLLKFGRQIGRTTISVTLGKMRANTILETCITLAFV